MIFREGEGERTEGGILRKITGNPRCSPNLILEKTIYYTYVFALCLSIIGHVNDALSVCQK